MKKKLPIYLLTTVSFKPNYKFFLHLIIGVVICVFIVGWAIFTVGLVDMALNFWRK